MLDILNASGVKVTSAAQNRAYYSPSQDRIVMPLSSQFNRNADYQATLLHELCAVPVIRPGWPVKASPHRP
ncbi:zincin-like metallopeptidase domain-containing protein [Escherichia coli]